jgi:hypothetical protein
MDAQDRYWVQTILDGIVDIRGRYCSQYDARRAAARLWIEGDYQQVTVQDVTSGMQIARYGSASVSP